MDNYSIDDMITSVLEKKPETFKDAFDSIMQQKVSAAIEDKKTEVASTMFNGEEPEESEEAEQEDTNAEEYEEENV